MAGFDAAQKLMVSAPNRPPRHGHEIHVKGGVPSDQFLVAMKSTIRDSAFMRWMARAKSASGIGDAESWMS
jgi:hypothetical protein